jgi:hypothetical protein
MESCVNFENEDGNKDFEGGCTEYFGYPLFVKGRKEIKNELNLK